LLSSDDKEELSVDVFTKERRKPGNFFIPSRNPCDATRQAQIGNAGKSKYSVGQTYRSNVETTHPKVRFCNADRSAAHRIFLSLKSKLTPFIIC